MHRAATHAEALTIENFVAQIVEASVAEFRQLKYLPTLDDSARGPRLTVTTSRKKLTAPEIQQMVEMYANNGYSQEKLAVRFHVSATTVSRFLRRARQAQ
jgi:hypothetical protein